MIVYGVFHNPCYHESAAALVSVHATKLGAYKAWRAAQENGWREHREHCLRLGNQFGDDNGGPLAEVWFMKPLEVQP